MNLPDIRQVWPPAVGKTRVWEYTDCMGEYYYVAADTIEEAREQIDKAIDRKQIAILRAELEGMRNE